jgi:hypothetical protein
MDWLLLLCFMIPAAVTVESTIAAAYDNSLKDPASFDDDKYLWIILGVSVAALLSIVGSAVINRRSTRDEFAATRSNSAGSLHKPAAMKPVAAEPVFLI